MFSLSNCNRLKLTTALVLTLPGLSFNAIAEKVSVGPYYLGMPAAEARKFGLGNCKPWASKTKCDATYGPLENHSSFTLLVDRAQTVVMIELKTELVYSKVRSQTETTSYKPKIDVPQCPKGFYDSYSCYYPPDKLLTKQQSVYSSYKTLDGYHRTTITAEVNRAKLVEFLRVKKNEANAYRRAQKVQYGK